MKKIRIYHKELTKLYFFQFNKYIARIDCLALILWQRSIILEIHNRKKLANYH